MNQQNIDLNQFSPFSLHHAEAYEAWRNTKLQHLVTDANRLSVDILDPLALTQVEIAEIRQLVSRHGMVKYRMQDKAFTDKALVHRLGEQLGMTRLDNNLRADEDCVTSLEVRPQQGNQYIPYTNKPLSWHTDGYYNRLDSQIHAIIMHCVRPAAEGGVNALIDHEQLYIRLRDENPDLIEVLMHPDAMTIPANIEDGKELRAARSGPVFSVNSASGRLHMRYSARKRNIEWRDDELTRQAAQRITELLADESLIVRDRLEAGEGIICNNILHNRSGFDDTESQKRLMYRARYFDYVH